MLRKLFSKIKQSFKSEAKPAAAKPASSHASKQPKPAHKGGHPAHDKRHQPSRPGQHTSGRHPADHARPQPKPHQPHAPAHHAPARPAHVHVAKPLPEVPKMDTAFTALGLGDRLAYAVQEKGYESPTPIQTQA